MDRNAYLDDVLFSYSMMHIEKRTNAYKAVAKELRDAIEANYMDKMYGTFYSGSIAKHTAVNTNFDIDFVAPFKRDSFGTLEEMYRSVYEFLDYYVKNTPKYTGHVYLRKQTVSIGFEYTVTIDEMQEMMSIDIVPGRELTQGDYPNSRDLNLYFYDRNWGFGSEDSSRQKTNIHAQFEGLSQKTTERQIIRLLKIWKKRNQIDIKSFVLELFTLKAMEGYEPQDLWTTLMYVLEYISKHAEDTSCHLLDPGNSNNDVLAKMDENKRRYIADNVKSLLRGIEVYGDSRIKTAFPENNRYKREQPGYEMRPGTQVPLPPSGKLFG